jgi:hypothetical protein
MVTKWPLVLSDLLLVTGITTLAVPLSCKQSRNIWHAEREMFAARNRSRDTVSLIGLPGHDLIESGLDSGGAAAVLIYDKPFTQICHAQAGGGLCTGQGA